MNSDQKDIQRIIRQALKEDQARADVTTRILIPEQERGHAQILVKEIAVVYGLDIVTQVFKSLDQHIKISYFVKDGQLVKKGQRIAVIKGKARSILSAERTALDFLGFLSGIATTTRTYVNAARPYQVRIFDTRKTFPGLRRLSKMAVKAGGGVNHRQDLNEMVMIKDNHLASRQRSLTIAEIIAVVRKQTNKKIILEVDTVRQFVDGLLANPDIILLDNMDLRSIKKVVALKKEQKSRCLLEVSGGVKLRNIRSLAKIGVDRISVGALTHSVRSIDFSLEFLGGA